MHYRGNAPAINDLVAGHVDIGLQQLVDSLEHIKAGQLRALAVLGPKRAPAMPDVPTIVEAGFPDVQGITFNGIFAPKATPPAVVEKLSAAIRAALAKKRRDREARGARLGGARQHRRRSSPASSQQETAKWTDVMKKANIKVKE